MNVPDVNVAGFTAFPSKQANLHLQQAAWWPGWRIGLPILPQEGDSCFESKTKLAEHLWGAQVSAAASLPPASAHLLPTLLTQDVHLTNMSPTLWPASYSSCPSVAKSPLRNPPSLWISLIKKILPLIPLGSTLISPINTLASKRKILRLGSNIK